MFYYLEVKVHTPGQHECGPGAGRLREARGAVNCASTKIRSRLLYFPAPAEDFRFRACGFCFLDLLVAHVEK